MINVNVLTSAATRIAARIRPVWQSLAATDLLFKVLAFAVLTPIFAMLWRSLLAWAGQSVLSDVDIARFFAGPFGWLCAIVLGASWSAIIGIEQAALLYILAGKSAGKPLKAIDALQFSARHIVSILAITTRLIARTLLVLAPFLLLAGAAYFYLLGEFDINYYLNERPTEFRLAIGVGIALVAVLAGILTRLYSSWFIALPLVLFDQTAPRDAMSTSTKLVAGKRKQTVYWLLTWGAIVLLANLLVTAVVGWMGKWLIPVSIGSLPLLATRVGMLVLILLGSNLIINLFASISFAGLLMHAYEEFNPNSKSALTNRMAEEMAESSHRRSIITRWRLLAACTIAVIGASLIGYWALNSLSLTDDVQIMAHRGSSKVAPENTLAAFQRAIDDGADWIEIDVQETSDGEVVVMHDSDFMKLAGNPLKIWDADLESLSKIDVGSWVSAEYSDQRVPTLAQVLRLCRDKVGINIELKYYGHDQALERRVVEIVEAEQMADQVMIMSLKPAGIAKVKQLRPDWTCGLLLSVYVGKLEEIKADFLAINSQFATRSFVRRAHNANKQVFVWTVNDAAGISRALNRKVDGILTDRPALTLEVLQQRSEMSNAERLLTEVAILFNQPPNNAPP